MQLCTLVVRKYLYMFEFNINMIVLASSNTMQKRLKLILCDFNLKLCSKVERKWIDTMLNINLKDNVVEKVNIMSKLTNKTPEEVVNETLWDNLKKIEDVPDELDYEKIWGMLEHDNPEGDDILDNLIRLGKEGWD